MVFSLYTPQPSRPEEFPLNNIISNLLGGYTGATQARYLQPTLEEQLQKAKLYNQYYGPEKESQLALRGAQTQQARAHTGLLGEQLRGARIENEMLPEKLKASIAEINAKAQKARLLQMIREDLFTGNQPIQNQNINSPMSLYSGQGMPGVSDAISQKLAAPTSLEQTGGALNSPPGNYGKAAIGMQVLGLGMPKIVDVNGKQVAITPFGNYDLGVQGLTEEQKAFQKGLGGTKAKIYDESVESYRGLSNQELALNELKNAVENNPEFMNVTGRIQKPLSEWFGTPAQKQLLGDLQTASGEIALQIAPSLKGAFTGRDQTLINSIKASPNDFPDVFIGKLRAQLMINNALKERSKLQAQLIEDGFSPLEASEKAAKETPLERFEPIIKGLVKHRPTLSPEEAQAELQRRHIARQLNGQ